MLFPYYTSQSIRLAVDLANTLQPVTGCDTLVNEDDLRHFLVTHEAIYEDTGDEASAKPNMQVVRDLYRSAIDSWEISADDVTMVRALRSALRRVFEQALSDEREAAQLLNEQLRLSGATPRISWHHGPLHLHFESVEAGCAHWLAATTVMGLAVVLCDYGAGRFGICAGPWCRAVFIDTSKNTRKRYCSEACAHRASVAAFRARQRTGS
jgi:predicted RNA-binding Zn ribbon-like protein